MFCFCSRRSLQRVRVFAANTRPGRTNPDSCQASTRRSSGSLRTAFSRFCFTREDKNDLAALFGVKTAAFNQAVKRNAARFPADFSFVLTDREFAALMSQIVISKGRGGRRKLPRVFTEHGAIMAASIL